MNFLLITILLLFAGLDARAAVAGSSVEPGARTHLHLGTIDYRQVVPTEARIRAVRVESGPFLVRFPQEGFQKRVELPWEGMLRLDNRQHSWQIVVESDDSWWPMTWIDGSETPGRLELRPRPSGWVEFEMATQSANASMAVPRLLFSGRSRPIAQLADIAECFRYDPSRWRCLMPAGVSDLEISIPQFVPTHFREVQLTPGETIDLGRIKMLRGASLTGIVVPESDGALVSSKEEREKLSGSTVSLLRTGISQEGEPQRLPKNRTVTGADGFFQMAGVAPGIYGLLVEREGYTPSFSYPVEISSDDVNTLEDAIVLRSLARVNLLLSPPMAPDAGPWQVKLQQPIRQSRALKAITRGPASVDGRWSFDNLERGVYSLLVSDRAGAQYLRRDIEILDATSETFIEIPVVPIEGRIHRNGEGVATNLVFGTSQGKTRIRLTSDEDGYFEGHLAHEGIWPLEIETSEGARSSDYIAVESVEVKRAPRQRIAKVDIELSDASVSGTVFFEGDPVPDAAVLAFRIDEKAERREAMVLTDEDGKFELIGLSPGHIQLKSYSENLSSTFEPCQVQSGRQLVHDLHMQENRTIAGIVTSESGLPVGGAIVTVRPVFDDANRLWQAQRTVTSASGDFELSIPRGPEWFDVLVLSTSFATSMQRMRLQQTAPFLALEVESIGGNIEVMLPLASENHISAHKITMQANGASWPLGSDWFVSGKADSIENGLRLRNLGSDFYSICLSQICDEGFLVSGADLVLDLTEESTN